MVIEDVLSSTDKIQGIQGSTGAGKTTALTVLRGAVEAQGYDVQGFAPTSRAARQFKEAGVEAGTLQGFLTKSAQPDAASEQKHFYFVDESSLASTIQMREFLSRLGPNDRVLLIGDTRQHQGVEAGRPFEQLQQAGMHIAKLAEIFVRETRHSNPRSNCSPLDSQLPLSICLSDRAPFAKFQIVQNASLPSRGTTRILRPTR